MFQETCNSQGLTHSRPADCSSRQAIHSSPDHPSRMVFASRNLLVDMHQVAPNSNRLLCDKVQQKVTSVCVISSRLPTLGSRSTRLPWKNLDLYAFPPVAIMGKVLLKGREYLCRGIILISPGWPNMPWYGDLVTLSQPVLSAD